MSDLRLVAEIGVNHDGDMQRAVAMTHATAEAGFDAVKFQYWNEDELLAPAAPNAGYQGPGDQHALLASLRLDIAALAAVEHVAHGLGLDFIVTPDGERGPPRPGALPAHGAPCRGKTTSLGRWRHAGPTMPCHFRSTQPPSGCAPFAS